ncbi:hypothetical protein PACTADRAFT_52120 [Pachysolen tannophilus NRRL Y-2460]|uniref:Oxidation resistance protein 1 n=1 Tax=Pachysolen tannophilus NRRL Y-2460 TaxID=669874 RepID=A0A1E4TP67_PACTA|nr:hypothetical protein PACTADRAFT_52120 [Pachysolen tannophilus NRRL Y-2460]
MKSQASSNSKEKFKRLSEIFKRAPKSPSPSITSDNNENYNFLSDPPLTPLQLNGYKSSTKHQLLSLPLAEELRFHLPPRLQISHDWQLLYSIEQNGISLRTLYNSMIPKDTFRSRKFGYLLVIRDENHQLFGCYVNEYLRPMDKKRYYGNGECFLWKTEISRIPNLNNLTNTNINNNNSDDDLESTISSSHEQMRLKVFPYTSLNDFIIYSNHDFISIGSGDGKFGLWIDSDLYKGASDSVQTFGNEPLSSHVQFKILGLEVWQLGD